LIKARNLDKSFGRTHAVRDLTFEVRPGVVTGFLGPNGAGKSTTLRLMLDLDRGGGETRFDGVRYSELERPLREVGCVLDARSFHPTRTARDHLRMLAAAASIPAVRVDEVLDLVGLGEVAGHRPRGFSLGMAQRLGLAAALLGDPHTLILDEPANGLDPHGIQWLREFLRAYADAGRTVLVSSHLLAEMALMAEDLVVIGRGRLIAAGPVDDFVGRFTHQSVVVRSPQVQRLATVLRMSFVGVGVITEDETTILVEGLRTEQVGDLAAAHSITLHELSVRTASLEQAFLEATGGDVEYAAAGARGPAERVTSG
jgi:ABC-2 type transport system ATP-binding protein